MMAKMLYLSTRLEHTMLGLNVSHWLIIIRFSILCEILKIEFQPWYLNESENERVFFGEIIV